MFYLSEYIKELFKFQIIIKRQLYGKRYVNQKLKDIYIIYM